MSRRTASVVSHCVSVFSALLLFCSVSSRADASVRCTTQRLVPGAPSSAELRYCLQMPERAAETDILILFLHGLGGSEKSWQTYGLTQDIERALEREGRHPAILTPSFGEFWLLKETPTPGGLPPLLPLVEELIERVKVTLPARTPVVVVGTSLGGYNALQLYFKRPAPFSAFALAGAAVVDASPFANNAKSVSEYVERTRAWQSSASTLFRVSRTMYLDESDFVRHSPLELALSYVRNEGPQPPPSVPLFLQVGAEDHFGFQLGNGTLQHLMRLAGLPVTFQLLAGGRGVLDHVVLDAQRTASFLTRFAPPP